MARLGLLILNGAEEGKASNNMESWTLPWAPLAVRVRVEL
jgi:hypothetical protein